MEVETYKHPGQQQTWMADAWVPDFNMCADYSILLPIFFFYTRQNSRIVSKKFPEFLYVNRLCQGGQMEDAILKVLKHLSWPRMAYCPCGFCAGEPGGAELSAGRCAGVTGNWNP